MASDLSHLAEGSMWPTSQHADDMSGNHAMTAPGSPSSPGYTRIPDSPEPREVELAGYDGRHLVRSDES
jgi:hypothetical protein